MGTVALVDANVCLRVLLGDSAHPQYERCVSFLKRPCLIESFVFPEIVYNVCSRIRKDAIFRIAVERGEVELFRQSPRAYITKCTPPSGWKKEAYSELCRRVEKMRQQYPTVKLYDDSLYAKTMEVAISTGYDWVDCALIASSLLYKVPVYSIDSDVIGRLSFKNGLTSMNLFNRWVVYIFVAGTITHSAIRACSIQ